MKSLVRKLWALPLFGMIFFWGVSMIGMPSNAKASGNSLIAASQLSPNKNLRNKKNESAVEIHGRIAKFKERETLVIDDGKEEIRVEYSDKYKPLRLRVGEAITVVGEYSGDGELRAIEIWSGGRRVYPQANLSTRIIAEQSKTRYDQSKSHNGNGNGNLNGNGNGLQQSATDANGNGTKKIVDIKKNGKTGQTVTIEGEVIDLPDQELIILKDSEGDEILIDIDDAQKTLRLKKGDKVNVQGNVTDGLNGKKELEATRIEKKNSH